MFNTEDEKLDIATGGDDDRRKSVIETISRFGDKEEQEIGKGLKIMTPRPLITKLPILLAHKSYLRYICFTKSARAFPWNPFFDFFFFKYQEIQWLQIQRATMVFLK